MTKQYIVKKVIFFLICMSLQIHGVENDLTPGEIEARRVLPNKSTAYSLEELQPIFHPLLHQEAKVKFDTYFGIVFNKDFPPPPSKHTPDMIFGGYRCLYNKMFAAFTLAKGDEQRDLQITAIYELMGFHRRKIAKFNTTLADEIPKLSVCPNCVKETQNPYEHKSSSQSS